REPIVVEMKAMCDDGLEARVTVGDITARKRAEEILSARTRVSEYAISHSLEEVLTKTLDEAEGLTGSQIGFFHFVDADQKTLTLQQWSTNTLRNMCTAEGKGTHYPADKAGVWVDALHQRRPVIHNDYIGLSHRKGLPPGHSPVIRELVVPILRGERIVGLLGVGNKPGDYEARDVDVVQILADLTWDIVERKQAEKSLREKEERLRLALQGADLGSWDWNVVTGRVAFNERWSAMLGYGPTEIEPHVRTWEAMIHPDDRAGVQEALARHLCGETPGYEIEHRLRHKSGDWVWVLDKGAVIERGATGQPVRMCGTHLDITEHRRLRDQLAQSQKMESIGHLAGGVAHEIRNQLQVVQGYSEMLLRRKLVTDEGQAMLDAVLKATAHSSTITGLLLAYGRKELLRPIVVSLRDCVAELGKILPHMLGEDNRVMIQSGRDECRVKIDVRLFQQAMLNLATNARDAMAKGGTLTLETACVTLGEESRQIDPELAEGQYVVVTVSDTGSGMDEATVAKAFEPFFTTKAVGKGTGLGLAMVYGFVKQSGGAVAMQSEPGRGTTVRLYFPPAAGTQALSVQPDRQPAKALHGVGETILLVEDELAVRALAAELLREAGYRVLEAANPEEALLLADRHEGVFDLLVTDIVMPGATGVALAEQLLTRYPGMGVLYMTGYSREELTRRGVSESVVALSKPFASVLLLEHVRRALGARKAAR
ncbi:MAG: GAF domain-containing protein, partial [Planctomycetota bacterium]